MVTFGVRGRPDARSSGSVPFKNKDSDVTACNEGSGSVPQVTFDTGRARLPSPSPSLGLEVSSPQPGTFAPWEFGPPVPRLRAGLVLAQPQV